MNSEVNRADLEVSCDLLVLGGGPGGYSAAFRGADLGLSTIIVERDSTLGGVCLNVGCIPSKALLHVAAVSDAAGELAESGVVFGAKTVDLDKLRAWKDSAVSKLTRGLQGLADGRKVRVVRGTGTFVSKNQLRVVAAHGETRLIRFAHAIIAAGSEAVDPYLVLGSAEGASLVGADPRIVDSTGALALPTLPKRMLVVGGGVIGLELATVYSALGAEVDIVEKGEQLMAGADRDFVRVWTRRNRRIRRILLSTVVSGMKKREHGLEISFRGQAQEPIEYDLILVATGRTPNGNRIGATEAGVRVGERGFIEVDSQMRTNVSHLFAVGDIVGAPMLAHKATHQGHVAAEAAAGLPSHFDARVIPDVAYTDPEIAWVGVTVEGAKQRAQRVRELVFPWQASGRAVASGREEGMTKLLIDEVSERVVGGGFVGTHAGDLIGELALAIEMGCHPADLAKTIHPHPTLCESTGLAAAIHEGACTELPLVSARVRK
jgi:dihydrolipoamide dehydrogenase